jgi:photosystem II stability/assembly factor-like uncharacterized protein
LHLKSSVIKVNLNKNYNEVKLKIAYFVGLLCGMIQPLNAQWVALNSGVSVPFRGVYFLDSKNGIFVGDNSTVLRTTNGGELWIKQTLPASGLFVEHAHIFDEQTAIVVGDKVFRTTNGGVQWTQVTISGNPSFSGVHFISSLLGFASSSSGKIYISDDGGLNWSPQTTNTTTFLTDITFADNNNGYAVGIGGTIIYTNNGGATWNQATSNNSNNLWGVYAVNSTIGYAVGGDVNGLNGNVLKTTDSGANWYSTTVDANSVLTGIYFIDSKVGYVGGTKIWKTTDGGQSWEMQKDVGETTVLFFSGDLTGYAGDHSGKIFKTTNGGTTGVIGEKKSPENFQLYQNYPNPFNPTTIIKFSISSGGNSSLSKVSLKIYTLLGKEAAILLDYELSPGTYEVPFNATGLASGVYFYRLEVRNSGAQLSFVDTKSLTLLR